MRHIPIRWRLTGWYVLVLAAILAALTAFVVTRLRADLTADVDRSLDAAGVQIAQAYRLEGDPELAESTRDLLLNAGLGESGAQLLTADGAVRRAVGAVPRDAPLVGPAAVAAALRGDRVVATVRPPGGDQPFRVSARAVRRGGRPEVLIAADGLAERDRAVRRVLVLLVIGGAGALILVGLGGWWVARKGLSPVRAMTERAGRVDIGDLTERIPVPPADDELRRLATTLNAMLARLEAGVAARERFVADASHELRAPLAAMRAELDVSLRQDGVTGDARAALASALEEVARMTRIVDNLLLLARADGGRLELLTTPADLRAVAERAAATRAATAHGRGVDIRVEGEPVHLAVDRERIEQVVVNLVDNAVRVSPAGGAVTVRVESGPEGAKLTVADAGPGVPAADRERIFARFTRGDPARGRGGGAGLGLAICAEIVQAHGGRIWVEDRSPHGAGFVVLLPGDVAGVAEPVSHPA